MKKRKMRLARHVARVGKMRNAYKFMVEKSEGKGPLGRPTRRGEDNIKMDLREVVWKALVWIHLAEDRDQWRALVNPVLNLRVP
jgi:hypothetical protein